MAVPTRPTSGAPIETAWGNVVHDGIVELDIQSGVAICPATASGVDNSGVTVVFPRPFRAGSTPVVVAASLSRNFFATVEAITATGCSTFNSNRVVGAGGLGARTNQWIAIGPRA